MLITTGAHRHRNIIIEPLKLHASNPWIQKDIVPNVLHHDMM
jgi:hypothetical protein